MGAEEDAAVSCCSDEVESRGVSGAVERVVGVVMMGTTSVLLMLTDDAEEICC
jgi:hypothetical protein